jgi:hypothetical protein
MHCPWPARSRILLSLAAVFASGCVVKSAKPEESKPSTMSNTQAVFELLDVLEKEMPWSVVKVQRILGVTLKKPSLFGGNQNLEFDGRARFSGLGITHVRFTPAGQEAAAALLIKLDKNDVDEGDVMKRFPKGFTVPPPPPGYGGVPDPRMAYVVDRDWGQVWFAFAAAGLWSVSLAVGEHGSPGI